MVGYVTLGTDDIERARQLGRLRHLIPFHGTRDASLEFRLAAVDELREVGDDARPIAAEGVRMNQVRTGASARRSRPATW
jgi:hypothetical protein